MADIQLYNSLTRKKELFTPLEDNLVRMYHCGPTVYDYAHIGNFRSYIFADILRRTMEYAGYDVRQVMNITDVGHLTSDADEGEDKMTTALLRAGKELTLENMREVADFYIEQFRADMGALHIKAPDVMPRASEYIDAQIAFIQKLEERGVTYRIADGIYFDTSTFSEYGALGGSTDKEHSRTGINPEKRSPRDFALWKFSSELGWDSPWGKGFPGWHIECSAMSQKELGEQFDIHTGGVDLKPVHHNNEVAQSEKATGLPPARFWLHSEFVTINEEKMAKSAGGFITVRAIEDKGYSPLAFRYLVLQAHYRTPLNFSWEALDGAQNALARLYEHVNGLPDEAGGVYEEYKNRFQRALSDDINTPQALAVLWELDKDTALSPADKRATMLDFDRVLGLGLADARQPEEVPYEVVALVNKRAEARAREDWPEADRLRKEIKARGFDIRDTEEGAKVRKT